MRYALVVSLFLVACQNHESTGRLVRVEKKLDDIQPAPAPVAPVAPEKIGFSKKEVARPAQTISDDAAARLMQEHKAVWLFRASAQVNGLVVQEIPGHAALYRQGADGAYHYVRPVPDGVTDDQAIAYHLEIQP